MVPRNFRELQLRVNEWANEWHRTNGLGSGASLVSCPFRGLPSVLNLLFLSRILHPRSSYNSFPSSSCHSLRSRGPAQSLPHLHRKRWTWDYGGGAADVDAVLWDFVHYPSPRTGIRMRLWCAFAQWSSCPLWSVTCRRSNLES
jgi:hypothetical protein